MLLVQRNELSALAKAPGGETWDFVAIPLSAVKKELAQVGNGTAFGAGFDFDAAGIGDMDPNTMVPGVPVFWSAW